jgi:mcsB
MWYDNVVLEPDYHFISSRVRIVRNLDNYVFPGKLDITSSKILVERVLSELKDIGEVENTEFKAMFLNSIPDIERLILREKRVINSTLANKKMPTGMLISKDEDISLIINGDDHIRFQIVSSGMKLDELWDRADKFDDYINERFNYAFDEKYGYMTSYPTNIGTGLKANIVLHLPLISTSNNFANLVSDLGRLGVSVKGVYGQGDENYGNFYDISNQKTLGQDERSLISQTARVAMQLNSQETQLRKSILKNHRIRKMDEVYKAYGILSYARRLTLKDALNYISALLQGVSDGLIKLNNSEKLFSLSILIQPSNIMKISQGPLEKGEIDILRADFIRQHLPKLIQ